jgi:2',3'-cyclic-nucleotide 2'-phosphodiesterase (5'-nucleotidase family)
VGHIFSDDLDMNNPELLRKDAVVANNWMLKAFSKFKLDVANLSYRDLRFAGMMLSKDKFEERVKETPFAAEMISANIIPAKDLDIAVAPKPYVIREVNTKRFPNNILKIGFIGLTVPAPGEKTGFVVEEPLQKIKQILPEVRKQADIVVVLAYSHLEEVQKLAKENQDIDLIIAANFTPTPPPPQREGKTIIVYAAQQTKSIGELRLYFNQDGRIGDFMNRYIALDSAIPDQPEAAKMNEASKTEVEAAKPAPEKVYVNENTEPEKDRKPTVMYRGAQP